MQWLHDNADALNVDVSKVMIYGESAGSGSVSNHLAQKESWPLFTRAAMESGPVAADWVAQEMKVANVRLEGLTKAVGCSATGADALRDCLQSKNTSEMFTAGNNLPAGDSLVDWAPVIDGVTLVKHPRDCAAAGEVAKVPILLGTNKNEGTLFTSIDKAASQTDYTNWISKCFSRYGHGKKGLEAAVAAAYPCTNYTATKYGSACFWASSDLLGDYAMTCAARRSARWLTQGGQNATGNATSGGAPVFQYFFRRTLSLVPIIEAASKKPFGVFHGSELALVFDFKPLLLEEKEKELAEQVVGYWVAFADTGNPSIPSSASGGSASVVADAGVSRLGGLPPAVKWPQYDPETDEELMIDLPMVTGSGNKKDLCDFWDKEGALQLSGT